MCYTTNQQGEPYHASNRNAPQCTTCNLYWFNGQDRTPTENYGWKIITKKRREIITKHLEAEVETYDQYLTGDVQGFNFESVAVYPDGREDVQYEASCWGFFGCDPATNGIAECLPVDIKDCEMTYE